MYSFVVLGIIPGTDIQISFQAWLAVTVMSFCFGPIIWREFKLHHALSMTSRRQAMHANQLHLRVR